MAAFVRTGRLAFTLRECPVPAPAAFRCKSCIERAAIGRKTAKVGFVRIADPGAKRSEGPLSTLSGKVLVSAHSGPWCIPAANGRNEPKH